MLSTLCFENTPLKAEYPLTGGRRGSQSDVKQEKDGFETGGGHMPMNVAMLET